MIYSCALCNTAFPSFDYSYSFLKLWIVTPVAGFPCSTSCWCATSFQETSVFFWSFSLFFQWIFELVLNVLCCPLHCRWGVWPYLWPTTLHCVSLRSCTRVTLETTTCPSCSTSQGLQLKVQYVKGVCVCGRNNGKVWPYGNIWHNINSYTLWPKILDAWPYMVLPQAVARNLKAHNCIGCLSML